MRSELVGFTRISGSVPGGLVQLCPLVSARVDANDCMYDMCVCMCRDRCARIAVSAAAARAACVHSSTARSKTTPNTSHEDHMTSDDEKDDDDELSVCLRNNTISVNLYRSH